MFGSIISGLVCMGVGVFALIAIIVACIKRTKGWIITASIFVLLGLGSIVVVGAFAVRQVSQLAKAKNERVAVTSNDGWVRLKVPGSWHDMPSLNAGASIRYANPIAEEYITVFSDARSDFRGSLQDFVETVTTRMEQNLEGADLGEPKSLTINGFPAIQVRLSGTASKVPVVYLHTSVETPDGFHQLVQWTLPSKEGTAFPVFMEVANSFELARPATSSSTPPALKVPSTPRLLKSNDPVERL